MVIERLVYFCVSLVLLGYILRRYIKSKSGIFLSLFSIQVVCFITQMIALFSNIYVDWFMQMYILIFAIILPACIFIAECCNINLEEYFLLKWGDFYARRNLYEKAIEEYKKAIHKNDQNSQTFVKLGRIYNVMGDKRTAFDQFARALEINRNDYRSYYEIGVIFHDMGKDSDAQIVLDNSLRIKPDFTPASEILAAVLSTQNKYDEAIHVYQNAIKYDPDNYQLYYSKGVVHTELRDFNEARECYEKAISLNPSLYQAYFSLGQIYLLKGELELAESNFKNSLKSDELMSKSHYQLAKVYMLKEEEMKAVAQLNYAINIDSSYKYKAESEPLFAKIKDYITGIHIANQVMQQAEAIEGSRKKRIERVESGGRGNSDEQIESSDDNKQVEDVRRVESKSANSIAREKLAEETRRIANSSEIEDFSRDEVFKKEPKKENKFKKILKMILGMDDEDYYNQDDENIVQDAENMENSNNEKDVFGYGRRKSRVISKAENGNDGNETLKVSNERSEYNQFETQTRNERNTENAQSETEKTTSRVANMQQENSPRETEKEQSKIAARVAENSSSETQSEATGDTQLRAQTESAENMQFEGQTRNVGSTQYEKQTESTRDEMKSKDTSVSANNDEEGLDIFEKFKRLKIAEEKKAERLRREQKIRQLEELKEQQKEQRREIQKNQLGNTQTEKENGQYENKQENVAEKALQNNRRISTYYDSDDLDSLSEGPVIVRTVGKVESEEAKKELERLEELRKTRNFEIEDSEKRKMEIRKQIEKQLREKINDKSETDDLDDESIIGEPHFDYMDRFRR